MGLTSFYLHMILFTSCLSCPYCFPTFQIHDLHTQLAKHPKVRECSLFECFYKMCRGCGSVTKNLDWFIWNVAHLMFFVLTGRILLMVPSGDFCFRTLQQTYICTVVGMKSVTIRMSRSTNSSCDRIIRQRLSFVNNFGLVWCVIISWHLQAIPSNVRVKTAVVSPTPPFESVLWYLLSAGKVQFLCTLLDFSTSEMNLMTWMWFELSSK